MIISAFTMHHKEFGDLSCSVPFSMYDTLVKHGKIEDPYYGENDAVMTALSEEDYEFSSVFAVSREDFGCKYQTLRFEGIDTVCDIYLNDALIGHTVSMHRIFEFNVKDYLKEGENKLLLHFYSPSKYIRERQLRHFTWGHSCTMDGFAQIRKANYMFGWDWGPTLPDMGVYRPITLLSYDLDRIENVMLRQVHQKTPAGTNVTITAEASTYHHAPGTKMLLRITAPDGTVFESELKNGKGSVTIRDAALWWPNGYGEQPLYDARVILLMGTSVLDAYVSRLGLRTLTVSTAPDKWGKEFCFVVNGIKIFSMGASYVPSDNILPRITPEKTRQLLESCIKANYNSVRIWGGGLYLNDDFYDTCDELGLILWHDFMVACCNIRLSEEFKENILAEDRDQIRRLRDHACMGLVCGNNEMEMAVIGWDECRDSALDKLDYLNYYEHLLPDLCDKECPDIFYWPSSPSSGGGFVDPQDQNRGDAHYWGAWHGSIPFESYRDYYFRFCSEFGFEAFPGMKTIMTFAREEDLNPFGAVMEAHQKCKAGNNKILSYLSDKYLYPYDFSQMVYASQLLQLDAIRYGVEHFRRFRGRCMGATYWQFNDSWPVCSWSAVDYYGRWKALMYGSRRFFAPILFSVHENGTSVTFNLSNETLKDFSGKAVIKIMDTSFDKKYEIVQDVFCAALSSQDVLTRDFEMIVKGQERDLVLAYELISNEGEIITSSSLLFTKPRLFHMPDPKIKVTVLDCDGKTCAIKVEAEKYASHVEIDLKDHDLILSDNYFDITSSDPIFLTCEAAGPGALKGEMLPDAETLQQEIIVRSVYDIGK